jgi:hypothetical protein
VEKKDALAEVLIASTRAALLPRVQALRANVILPQAETTTGLAAKIEQLKHDWKLRIAHFNTISLLDPGLSLD